MASIFQAPTAEELAAILRQEGWSAPSSSVVMIQPGDSRPPIFFLPGNLGNVFTDLGDLARHLGPDQPFYGLQDGIQNPARIDKLAAHKGLKFLDVGCDVSFPTTYSLHRSDQAWTASSHPSRRGYSLARLGNSLRFCPA